MKNALEYAVDEKEKNGILELIQIYENQMDDYSRNTQYNNGNGFNDSEMVKRINIWTYLYIPM